MWQVDKEMTIWHDFSSIFSENSTWGGVCLTNVFQFSRTFLDAKRRSRWPIFFSPKLWPGFHQVKLPTGGVETESGHAMGPCAERTQGDGTQPSPIKAHGVDRVDTCFAEWTRCRRFFNKCGKVPVSKEKRFVTKVAEIPSKWWFGKNLWIFFKRNFGVLEDLMKLKSMFRVFVTLRIQSLAHRKKHGFFCGVPMLMCMIHLLRLCVGGVCRHIWGCDELRSLYFCTISEGFVFLTHLDKPERVIPFTCCQPPFGLIVGKWAKGPKVCIYRVHQTLTPLKNTQPFHMRLTFANVTSFCLFWGSDCWEVGRWECHRAIDSICGWLKTCCTRSAWVAWKPLTAGRDRALDLLGFLRSNKTESKNESLFFCFSGMVFWGQKFLSFR